LVNSKSFWSETFHVLRPVCVLLVAIAVAAMAMAVEGWHTPSLLLAGMILLLGGLLVMNVIRAVQTLGLRAKMLREAFGEAERHYIDVLRRIIRFFEARENYATGQSERVGQLAEQIGGRLGLSDKKCSLMCLAGQLHDIGLVDVSDSVLNKPYRWGTSDFQSIQKHAEMSYEILKPLECLAEVLPAIRYHHERMNGTGYPFGLKGDEIPIEARILAVADAFDAMTHDRPHRRAVTPLAAMCELRRCSPAGYDPQCVAALAEVVHLPDLEVVAAPRRDVAELQPA